MMAETDARITMAGSTATPEIDPRLVTVLIGAAIPGLLASAAWWLGVPFLAVVGAGGVVAGPLVAYRRADRLTSPGWRRTSIVLGVQAALVASVVTALVMGIMVSLSYAHDPLEGVASAILWAGMALAYGMVLGTPIAVPTSFVVGFLVHRAAWLSEQDARRHLRWLVIVTVGASLLTVASATGVVAAIVPGVAPMGWPS